MGKGEFVVHLWQIALREIAILIMDAAVLVGPSLTDGQPASRSWMGEATILGKGVAVRSGRGRLVYKVVVVAKPRTVVILISLAKDWLKQVSCSVWLRAL